MLKPFLFSHVEKMKVDAWKLGKEILPFRRNVLFKKPTCTELSHEKGICLSSETFESRNHRDVGEDRIKNNFSLISSVFHCKELLSYTDSNYEKTCEIIPLRTCVITWSNLTKNANFISTLAHI